MIFRKEQGKAKIISRAAIARRESRFIIIFWLIQEPDHTAAFHFRIMKRYIVI
jgi:hypothetical protein